jgi:chromosome segregation ATPase
VDQPTSFYEVTERLTQMETNHKINDLRQKWIQAREQTATAQQSQNTKEEVQRLKEEIAVMNQLLEEAEAQHRTMSDKNKALQEKLDQATIELDDSRDQVSYLQEEIRRASKSQYGKEKLEQSKIDTLEFDPKDDLETMLIRIEDANSTKLAFASSVAGSKLKELKNFMMNENNRRILFETLKVMGSELHELYMKGPADIEEEFKSQISTKNRWLNSVRLVRGESSIVKSTNRLARMREGVYGGKVYDGYAHISYGNRNPEMFRIHYSWDFELKRIIVTVVTDHLENGSTQKLK